MKELVAKVNARGQVTLPATIRNHLGVSAGDSVVFRVADSGEVQLKVSDVSSVNAVAGAAGSLRNHLDWQQVLEVARDDAIGRNFGPAPDAESRESTEG
jgi:AbrB family looped-hinge helix DNA binding protein